MQGAVALAIVKNYQGETIRFWDCFNKGLSKILTLILTIVIMGLIMGLAVIPMAIFITVGGVLSKALAIDSALGVGLGVILGAVLFISILVMMGMAIPACAVEKLGAIDSLRRSASLTKGSRLTIMIIYFFELVAVCAFTFGGLLFLASLTTKQGGLEGLNELFNFLGNMEVGGMGLELTPWASVEANIIFGLVGFLSQYLVNVVNGSIYLELLITKKDRDLDELVRVFE
jgi:hypothetical protein